MKNKKILLLLSVMMLSTSCSNNAAKNEEATTALTNKAEVTTISEATTVIENSLASDEEAKEDGQIPSENSSDKEGKGSGEGAEEADKSGDGEVLNADAEGDDVKNGIDGEALNTEAEGDDKEESNKEDAEGTDKEESNKEDAKSTNDGKVEAGSADAKEQGNGSEGVGVEASGKEGREAETTAKTDGSNEKTSTSDKNKGEEAADGKDVTKPLILNNAGTITIQTGSEFNPDKYISYIDDKDPNPVLTVKGDKDTSVAGSKTLKFAVEDNAGNVSSWDVTLNVVDELPEIAQNPDTRKRIDFADFKAENKKENTLVGIDVSKWQGEINFDKVKAEGVEFVLMRLCRYDGEFVKDDYFERNYKEAKKAGLQVGAYFYTTDNDEEKLRSHMKWIKEQLDGRELDFPLVFDWESWNRVQRYHLSIEGLNHLMDVFAEEAESFGYDAMLYGSKYYLDIIWGRRNDYPVWVAQYKSYTDYEGDYEIWQSTNIGRINGIAGDVDFDVWYLDAAETNGAENVNSENGNMDNENAVKDNVEKGNKKNGENSKIKGFYNKKHCKIKTILIKY
jgi:GH25 family lysozyme M1 (1,4-beta-N-acetylmuramidase)